MQRMYAPWRSKYTTSTAHTKNENAAKEECTFCNRLKQKKDAQNFIIKRFKHNVVFLNRYPYNAGHILVMPLTHHDSLDKLSPEVRAEMMEILSQSAVIMKKTLEAHGANIGLNLGKAGGAGIPSHLHFHVLPRWTGDTNFLPALAETKQVSFDLKTIYKELKKAFATI